MFSSRLLSVVLACAVVSTACGDPAPQPIPEAESAGEIVYQYFCERSVSQAYAETPKWAARVCVGGEPPESAPADLKELHSQRDEIIAAYESWVPPEDDQQLRELIAANPWEETLATPVGNIADALDRVANDDETMLATARFRARAGYRPLGTSFDPLYVLLTYPELNGLSAAVLPQLTAVEAEVLALEWATASHDATDLEPGFADASHPDLKRGPVVLARDVRGLARPNPESSIPFADSDGDGLYDVDEHDRWIDADGALLDVATPFATTGDVGARSGVAVDATGVPIYLTKERGTVGDTLVALMGEWAAADSSLFLQWLGAFRALLGQQDETTATYGAVSFSYETFDPSESALVDAVYSAVTLLSLAESEFVLELVSQWVDEEEPAFTNLIETVGDFAASPTQLPPGSTAPADTVDLLSRIAQTPGMLEAIASFLETDEGVRLTTSAGEMMRNKARVTWDPNDAMGPPVGLDAVEAVDRSRPGELGNRSQFERLIALIDAMRGVRICSRAGSKFQLPDNNVEWPLIGGTQECQLLEIPNLGEAFLRSFVGSYEVTLDPSFTDFLNFVGTYASENQMLEATMGIEGFTRTPSPQALSRLLFWALADETGVSSCDPLADNCNGTLAAGLIDPVSDRHGDPLIEQYHGTSFVLEDPAVFSSVRSWVFLFTEIGEEAGGFSEIGPPAADPEGRCAGACWPADEFVAVAHTNWSTPEDPLTQSDDPTMPNFAAQGGLRNYEEDLAALLVDDEFGEKWRIFMATAGMESRDELDGSDAIIAWFGATLDPARNEGLTTRQGDATVSLAAGEREVTATPAALVIDAEESTQTAFAGASTAASIDSLQADVFGRLFTMQDGEAGSVWRDREARAMLILGLDQLAAERAEAMAGAGLESWAAQVADDLASWISSPRVATLMLFIERLMANAGAELAAFFEYVASNHLEWVRFEYANYREAMVDETRRIALARGWSEAIVPGVGAFIAGDVTELDAGAGGLLSAARVLQEIQAGDSGEFATALLARLVEPGASQGSVLDQFTRLTDVVIRAFVGEEATELDVTRSLLRGLSDVMSSDQLGVDVLLERLAESVEESA